MIKRKSPEEVKAAWRKRQAVWAHNSLFGANAMIRTCAGRVIESRTASSDAKITAAEIIELSDELYTELLKRADRN